MTTTKFNPMAIQDTFKRIQEETASRLAAIPKRRQTTLVVNDLLVLAAAGEAVLKTNTALKGERRRMLRKAVDRALKFVETL